MSPRHATLFVLTATVAHAVPPTPVLRFPVDGGWAQRQPEFEAAILPSIPVGVTGFQFEVDVTPGTAVYQADQPVDRSTSNSSVFHPAGPGLPDAGLLYWRARAVDDAGSSPWSAFEPFRIDDLAPPLPAPLTVTLDGGDAFATWPAVTDSQSGFKEYHLLLGQLDAPDASFLPYFDTRYLPTATNQRVRLGPGRWILGVHAHDQVTNFSGGSTPSAELFVPLAPGLVPPEAPRAIRFDGGAVATLPYTRFTPVRWTWGPDAGANTTGYVLIARAAGTTAWNQLGESAGNVAFTDLGDGRWDVRVATLEPGLVSDYSAPTQILVDTTAPFTPSPAAQLDAGVVTLRWPSVRDRGGSSGSGVLEYRVERCCPTVSLPNVADVPDASVSTVDSPGPGTWRWDVRAVDRATNVGLAGSAFIGPPPPQPAPPVPAPTVTRLPVALSWLDVDAGAPVTWNLFRLDAAGGSTAVAVGTPGLAATDPAPQGRWRYTLQAIAGAQTSAVSLPSAEVLVDTTAPDAGTPSALRSAAREVRVSWDAEDRLAGLGATNLFRETNGVEQLLGPRTSPATDLPADGTHRYRVEVADLAGNVTATAWSAPVVTPGTTLTIAPVEGQLAQCGRPAVVDLQAMGEPATKWSLVGSAAEAVAIDETTGRLTFTPTKASPSPFVVTVRAESAASLDEKPVTFTVSCEPVALAVACGCGAGEGPLLLSGLALWLARRRKRRVSP